MTPLVLFSWTYPILVHILLFRISNRCSVVLKNHQIMADANVPMK